MLPREHRITRSQDFRAVMRGGARAGTETVVVSVLLRPAGETSPSSSATSGPAPWRCGFIVSKAVGNAVVRHRVQRRLRHLVADLVPERLTAASEPPDSPDSPDASAGLALDVVVRALPAAAEADHPALRADLASGLDRALRRGRRGRRRGAPSGSAA